VKEMSNQEIFNTGPVSQSFLSLGVSDYLAAIDFVRQLPYGRNTNGDPTLVLKEMRGTCSTKHSLLATLAKEINFPILLKLGIYKMSELNTPGVGVVLKQYGVSWLPEAHCYLSAGNTRIDATKTSSPSVSPFADLLYEEEIEPDMIGSYKTSLHRKFLEDWALENSCNFDLAWLIREKCIKSLEAAG